MNTAGTLKYTTAVEAVKIVESNNRVFIHGGAATPVKLLNALLDRGGEITNVELTAISTYGDINWNRQSVLDNFFWNSLFVSENVRGWVNSGRGAYVPVFLSEIPQLFDNNVLPLDVAIIQVSEPDEHGYCTLGTSPDIAISATANARKIIAHVNPAMPRVAGEGLIHISRFSAAVYEEAPLPEINYSGRANTVTQQIGCHVASVIDDGATLQMGIGAIPDAVLKFLADRRHLGIHTEMFSDGVVSLIESGAIDNSRKTILPGRTVSAFVLGTKKVYDFINNNLSVNCLSAAYVNDPGIIKQNPGVCAINSAIEIDITGQVCADSIGTYQFSGIGGQMDFMRGASLSKGGKSIIALPSATKDGLSRIVGNLKEGAGVVTTRGHIHYVATEYGIVDLYGKNMEQRGALLISIAHPDHRDALEEVYFKRFGRMALTP
jgi:acyl-CoA hydrolase